MSNPGPYKYKTKVIVSSTDTSKRNSYYDVEGGALNSGYKDFDVGCIVSNDLGLKGWTYGKDFYFNRPEEDVRYVRIESKKGGYLHYQEIMILCAIALK